MNHGHCCTIVSIIGVLIGLCGCEPDTVCREKYSSQMEISLHLIQILADSTRQKTDMLDSVTVWAVGNDSIIMDNGKNVKKIQFFLRPDTSLTELVLLYHEQTDTLQIYHTNDIHFYDMACGCGIWQTIDSIDCTQCHADSIIYVNTAIEAVPQENIQLWLHP